MKSVQIKEALKMDHALMDTACVVFVSESNGFLILNFSSNALLSYFLLIVTLRCGGSSSENCTYFESSGTASTGACRAQICPCSNNICQVSRHSLVHFFNL